LLRIKGGTIAENEMLAKARKIGAGTDKRTT